MENITMEVLPDDAPETAEPTATTSKRSTELYAKNLFRLNDKQPIKNYNFLKNHEEILEKIQKYKPNTQRSYLISIVSTLKPLPKFKKYFKIYYDLMMQMNKDLKTQNTKSETQKENWMSQDAVKDVYQHLADEVSALNNKKKAFTTEADYNTLLSFMVLSLYVLQPPRRNRDYQMMVIGVPSSTLTNDDGESPNFLDLENNKFVFNNYKTKKTYKTQETSIPSDLMEVIKLYLAHHPSKPLLKKSKKQLATSPPPFLVDFRGEPLVHVNAITRILNKVFKKNVGVSMLRNIYLTDKYREPVKGLDADAHAMGTSSNTIMDNYVKVDEKE